MYRVIFTITAILTVIIGGILLVKSVIPDYLWVNAYICNTSLVIMLRNDFPVPIKVESITVLLYDKNGDLMRIKSVDLEDGRLPTGFTLRKTMSLEGLPVGEVAYIVVRVDYALSFIRGSVSAGHAPICPV